jgi:hypothetical protein
LGAAWTEAGRAAGVALALVSGIANGLDSVTFMMSFYHFQKAYRRSHREIPGILLIEVLNIEIFLAQFPRTIPYRAEECFLTCQTRTARAGIGGERQ